MKQVSEHFSERNTERFKMRIPGSALLFTLMLVCLLITGQAVAVPVTIEKSGKQIFISGILPGYQGMVEIQFFSNRNNHISWYSEVSENDPLFKELSDSDQVPGWEIFYPVVDMLPSATMTARAEFDASLNTLYSVNGMFNTALFIASGREITLERNHLLNWENNIYINSNGARMTSFYLADRVKTGGQLDLSYTLLSDSWSGDVVIRVYPGGNELARVRINGNYENPEEGALSSFPADALSRERLVASLNATLKYTLRSIDRSEYGKTANGLNLFYDLESKTYRRPTWVWGWGPSIKMLIDAADLPGVQSVFPGDTLLRAAIGIGEASLEHQVHDPGSPAHGIILSRWSENKGTLTDNYGYEEYYSIADAQFLAGWGWIPLYKATRDVRYLDGARLLTETTDKLVQEFDILPMDYMVRAGRWKDYALNEQGFGTEGINELFKVEADPEYQRIGHEYMQMLLAEFDSESGIWNRKYLIPEQERVPTAHHTRGVGWAMEGLIAVYELTGDPDYLVKAEKMAKHLLDHQLSGGSWSYDFKSEDASEISEKGTALWSLLFYKLYQFTGDAAHLSAARKALLWCLDNQYDGPDVHAHGGVPGVSRQSGVVYRKWFPLACSYTSGFFGLAVLEELKLQEQSIN